MRPPRGKAPRRQAAAPCPPTHTWSLTSSSAFSAIVAPTPANPQGIQPSATLGSSLLHAKLVLLKHTAEQVGTPWQRWTPPRPATPPGAGVLAVTLDGHRRALRRPGPPQGGNRLRPAPQAGLCSEPLPVPAGGTAQ